MLIDAIITNSSLLFNLASEEDAVVDLGRGRHFQDSLVLRRSRDGQRLELVMFDQATHLLDLELRDSVLLLLLLELFL